MTGMSNPTTNGSTALSELGSSSPTSPVSPTSPSSPFSPPLEGSGEADEEKKSVKPQSGINFVLYNSRFDVVEENTGYLPVDNKINAIQILATDMMVMTEAGFIEIFVNNDAQTPVYYDNMTVTHRGGNAMEVNAYYPYGMIIPDLSVSAMQDYNAYKWSAKELQEELNLNWYDHGFRMYDPAVGRWWAPDALAEKYYSISPYAYCFNDPVNMIDLFGLDPVYRDGKYYEDDGTEVDWDYVFNWISNNDGIGATYHFQSNGNRVEITNTVEGNRGNDFFFNGTRYTANSYMTLMGRDGRNKPVGDFSTITILSEDDIVKILGHAAAVFYDRHRNLILEAIYAQSIGGLLDYKNQLYQVLGIHAKSLIAINGIVYNPNEAGNFLWGMVIEYFGGIISPNWIAQTGTRLAQGRDDEPWEQRAISAGRAYGISLYYSRNELFDRDVLHYRLIYRKSVFK
jgi:RHS repeat-associated protein